MLESLIPTLVHLFVVVLVLGAIAYFINWVAITPPIIKTILWVIFIVAALTIALLPILGIYV